MDLGKTSGSGLVSNNVLSFDGGTISFTGSAGIYQGAVKGVAAPPWTPTGVETKNYFAAEPNGDVIFNFQSSQKYFAVNWGSVDSYNSLNFYQNGALVKSVSGSQVSSNPTGVQNASGSYLVNANFNGAASFDRVVMKSASPAFEFNIIAFAPQVVDFSVISGAGPTVVTLLDTVKQTVVGAPAPLPALAATPLGILALFGATGLFLRSRRKC